MKIKKITLDTYLIIFLMYAAILPTFLAKPLIFILVGFVSLKIILCREFFFYFNKKILIFVLLLPGLYTSLLFDLKEFLRYSIILLIIFGLPFTNFKIKSSPLIKVSLAALFYLVVTQILLAHGNQPLLSFREFGYADEWSYIFNYGTTSNLFKEMLSFNTAEGFRAGGIYYNPNILAGVIFLYYLIFYYSNKYYENQTEKKYINFFFERLIMLIVATALLFTKSRTIILSFLLFIVLQNFNIRKNSVLQINKNIIFSLILAFLFVFLQIERIYAGIVTPGQSFYEKFNIFYYYISSIDLPRFLFGGTFDLHFDTEIGYLFGGFGLSGVIAYFLLLRLIYKNFLYGKLIVLLFLVMGLGTTVFFSLLKISIIIPLLILGSSNRGILKYKN
jgi:hypothetical protein